MGIGKLVLMHGRLTNDLVHDMSELFRLKILACSNEQFGDPETKFSYEKSHIHYVHFEQTFCLILR